MNNSLIDDRFETKTKQLKQNETKRTNKHNETKQTTKKQRKRHIIILIVKNVFHRDYFSGEIAGHGIFFVAVAL